MRMQMAAKVAWGAVTGGEIRLPLIIRALRRHREHLAETEVDGFEQALFEAVGGRFGVSAEAIGQLHQHWFDTVPLPLLMPHVVPGAPELFAALRKAGVTIAVLSDHRAEQKLNALGLVPDMVVSAADVGVQKPNPRGLETILQRTGFAPGQTVVIGDRRDRDGAIASRVGAGYLQRGTTPDSHFRRFDDAVFQPILVD